MRTAGDSLEPSSPADGDGRTIDKRAAVQVILSADASLDIEACQVGKSTV